MMNSVLRMALSAVVALTSLTAASMTYAEDATEEPITEGAMSKESSVTELAELDSGCVSQGYVEIQNVMGPVDAGYDMYLGTLYLMRSNCGLYAYMSAQRDRVPSLVISLARNGARLPNTLRYGYESGLYQANNYTGVQAMVDVYYYRSAGEMAKVTVLTDPYSF